MPAAMRSSVLLLPPFGPMITTFWPRSTSRFTSISTTLSPYAWPMPLEQQHIAFRAAVPSVETDLALFRVPLNALDARDGLSRLLTAVASLPWRENA
jgi:hypothetical protein